MARPCELDGCSFVALYGARCRWHREPPPVGSTVQLRVTWHELDLERREPAGSRDEWIEVAVIDDPDDEPVPHTFVVDDDGAPLRVEVGSEDWREVPA